MNASSSVSVGEVMTTPLMTVSPGATVREAAVRMRDEGISALFVPGASAGIITTTDVVEAVADDRDPSTIEVAEVMTAPVERISTAEDLVEAAAMMTNFGIKHLPVIDEDGDYVGMVSTTDLAIQLA